MQFRDERHQQAVRAAFLRITADPTWKILCDFAAESVVELEQKSIREDDEEKAKTYRHDARGARKFWQNFIFKIEAAKSGDPDPGENSLDVATE
jgi:hypothetical protein